jgi:ribonucleoside-diphosphate reductase alpha chain
LDRRVEKTRFKGAENADRAALHQRGTIALRGHRFRLTTSEIRNPDGSVVFHADGVEVPEQWSQVASDVLAQKYFRKAGVPRA